VKRTPLDGGKGLIGQTELLKLQENQENGHVPNESGKINYQVGSDLLFYDLPHNIVGEIAKSWISKRPRINTRMTRNYTRMLVPTPVTALHSGPIRFWVSVTVCPSTDA